MALRWYGGDFQAYIGKKLHLRDGADYFASRLRVAVGRAQPTRRTKSGRLVGLDPSKPGEPPKVVSRQGQGSIAVKVINQYVFQVEVIGYMAMLDVGTRTAAPRPWILPTLQNEQRAIAQIIAGGGG